MSREYVQENGQQNNERDSDLKIKYYEVLKETAFFNVDEKNKVGVPIRGKSGKKWTVNKGKYVKSFGDVRTLRTQDGKHKFLILVNGAGILNDNVALYNDEVDDCGCDGNPIATPTDLQKLNGSKQLDELNEINNVTNQNEKVMKNENVIENAKEKKTDKNGLIGFLIGAAIGGGIMWFSTKDKKKTIIGAVVGALLGMIFGYLIGRRGTKKIETVEDTEAIEIKNNDDVEKSTSIDAKEETSNKKQTQEKGSGEDFYKIGDEYTFTLPQNFSVMSYNEGTMFVSKDKNNKKVILNKGQEISGKVVEIKNPNIFIFDPIEHNAVKIQSKKPLPYIKLKGTANSYIPLSAITEDSIITKENAEDYLSGVDEMVDEIYVKGRYSGLKAFNLMYCPQYDKAISGLILKKAEENKKQKEELSENQQEMSFPETTG